MDLASLLYGIEIKEKLKEIRTVFELYLAYSTALKPFLAKVKAKLSTKSPYSVQIDEANNFLKVCETYKKIMELLEECPKLKEEPIVADFLEKNMPNSSEFDMDIIQQQSDGQIKIIPPEDLDRISERAKEEKEKEVSEKVNAVPIKDVQNFYEYKYEKKVAPKGVIGIIDKMNVKHKSLLSLSAWIEKLYAEKRADVVEEIKFYIYQRYYSYGSKFANLYIKGYLKSLFSRLYKQQQTDPSLNIDGEISNFVLDKAKAIYFIHPYMDENDMIRIANQINDHLRNKVEYVAIHSLGANVEKAKEMVKWISPPLDSEYIERVIKEKRPYEFSKIWYGKDGIKIYSLITERETES